MKRYNLNQQVIYKWNSSVKHTQSIKNPVNWSARHVDSCGKAAAMLRPRSAQREEAQRRPAESEVPGTEINSPYYRQPLLNL
jgi:hypothetical protein